MAIKEVPVLKDALGSYFIDVACLNATELFHVTRNSPRNLF